MQITKPPHIQWRQRSALRWAGGLFALASATQAAAFNFNAGPFEGSLKSKLTVGAGWRVESRDEGLIGKLNVPGQQTLCQPDDCISFDNNPEPNQRLMAASGSYSAHAFDNGNLNYDKGDLISALAKINSTLTADWENLTFKVGYIGFFDVVNFDFRDRHSNTLLQPARTARSSGVSDSVGLRGEIREAYLQYSGEALDRTFSVALGAQRVRWGEANFHPVNTLDVINAQDAILPRQPGLALTELSVPTQLLLVDADLFDGVTTQLFYQYGAAEARPEPDGTFFSSADIIGGTYIEAAPGQFAEDPDGTYVPPAPVSLLSSSTRRLLVQERDARASGQYGVKLSGFADELLGGTEIELYYARYHSRLPYLSVTESQQSCLRRARIPGNFASAAAACSNATGVFNGGLQSAPSLATEPVPVDTSTVLLTYPENIQMFGVSFNTTIGGWAISGEYSYRPNLPVQIAISDVLFAGAQQSFATQDIPIVAGALPGQAGTTLPGARTFLPDFISTYRGRTIEAGNEFQPGEFVAGYERLKVGQFVLGGLKVLPGYVGSDDIIVLVEGGFTHVVDLPENLYFQGQADGTHPGPGADGTGPGPQTTSRLNPTQQTDGFATDFAWGLRGLVQMTYSNVLDGLTLKPTLIAFKDVSGTAPFPMQNYVEGNTWLAGGLQFKAGESIEGSLLYMYFDGSRNTLQDRDNVQISLSYFF